MNKNKFVQYECPICHTLFPEIVQVQFLNLATGQFEMKRAHPQKCAECGIGLQRRVKRKVS